MAGKTRFEAPRWSSTVTCLLLVLAIGLAGRQLAQSAWESLIQYRSPYRMHAKPGQGPGRRSGPRLVGRVILVTMEGLRLDISRRLSFLNELRSRGAEGDLRAGQPSLSNPGRAVLATGAWADVHGITSNFTRQPVEVDSVFSLARLRGLRTAAAGTPFWSQGFAPYLDELFPPAQGPQGTSPDVLRSWQQRRCAEVLGFVREAKFDFLAVDWTAGEIASRHFGALSPATEQVYATMDGCLRDLVASQDLRHAVVLVTADHGHVDRWGHGAIKWGAVTVPLVLAGGPVRAGAKFRGRQVDVAPTICALLGLPLPTTTEGMVLLDALELDSRSALLFRVLRLRQQSDFGVLRRAVLAGTMREAVRRERSSRADIISGISLALVLLVIWLFTMVLRGAGEWKGAAAALAAFYLVYFALLNQYGLGEALSPVNRENYLALFYQRDVWLAGGALLAAALAMGLVAGHADLRLSAATTLLVSLSLAAQVIWVYWSEGWIGQWMPDLDFLFRAYLNLLALLTLCFALWVAPLALAAGALLRRGLAAR